MSDNRDFALCAWCDRMVSTDEIIDWRTSNGDEWICPACARAGVLDAARYEDPAFRRSVLLRNPAVIDYVIDEMEQQFQ